MKARTKKPARMPAARRRPFVTALDSIALGASTETRSPWPRKPGTANEAASKRLPPTVDLPAVGRAASPGRRPRRVAASTRPADPLDDRPGLGDPARSGRCRRRPPGPTPAACRRTGCPGRPGRARRGTPPSGCPHPAIARAPLPITMRRTCSLGQQLVQARLKRLAIVRRAAPAPGPRPRRSSAPRDWRC